jgi:CBS domain containing-hemolysin-like protein
MAIRVPSKASYETVAGFIMSSIGRVPVVGDEVVIENGTLRVERMDGRRIDRVRFTPEASEVQNDA